jgi:16S rRNA (guanine(527)-N(7))-methyltransferase RsmG
MEALARHCELMLRWNRTINLTSITRIEEVVERHYGESIAVVRVLPAGRISIVDVGSGAGFPGVPIAILRADSSVTLVEAHQRKSVFLREATRGWANVKVVARRVEEVEGDFDWVVSRAVGFDDLAPFLGRVGRHFALLMGSEEPKAVDGLEWTECIGLPGKNRVLRVGHRHVSRETRPVTR